MKIILASQSPRRKQFLILMGVEFEVMSVKNEEKINKKQSFAKIVKLLAQQKATETFEKTKGDRMVIGSDTIVVCKGEIMGKPKDNSDAERMLKKLSGNTNFVYTGLCVLVEKSGFHKQYICFERSKVVFCAIPDNIIDKYIDSGEPTDKAGAYAIQGIAGNFIKHIKGNPASIVGLPTQKLFNIFLKENIEMFNFKTTED